MPFDNRSGLTDSLFGLARRLGSRALPVVLSLMAAPVFAGTDPITLLGGVPGPAGGTAQITQASAVANAQGTGAIKDGTFSGLTFQGNWFVSPTDLSRQNGDLAQWTLLSSNNGNLFNLTALDLTWRGGQKDTLGGWLNFYLNGDLVDTGLMDKNLYTNANSSLSFEMGAFGTTTHVGPANSKFYDRVDIVFDKAITSPSIGVQSFALRSTSPTVTFGLAPLPESTGLTGPNAPAAVVPEPETYALWLAGLGVVGLMSRRRRGSSASNRG